jgi:hypothetical protein
MSGSELSPTSHLRPVPSDIGSLVSKVGFPIRKSADQSFFAAPHGLSQRSTSFIASQRQGIHRMPLGHLIALIINAHPARQRSRSSVHANGSIGRTLNRKTSLLRIVPTACGQAADESIDENTSLRRRLSFAGQRGCRCSEIAHRSRRCVTISARSDPTSSRCQISRRPYQAGWLDGGRASRSLLRTSRSSAGGARRNRTDDLLLAKQALSQLSYGPSRHQGSEASIREERARRYRYLIPESGGPGKI